MRDPDPVKRIDLDAGIIGYVWFIGEGNCKTTVGQHESTEAVCVEFRTCRE